MTPPNLDLNPDPGTPISLRFLGGATLGGFIVAIFASYSSLSAINWTQVGFSLFFVLACGLLACVRKNSLKNIIPGLIRGLETLSL